MKAMLEIYAGQIGEGGRENELCQFLHEQINLWNNLLLVKSVVRVSTLMIQREDRE